MCDFGVYCRVLCTSFGAEDCKVRKEKSMPNTVRCAGALSRRRNCLFSIFGAFPSDRIPKTTKDAGVHFIIHSFTSRMNS
jgi:hypothetical protein